MPSLKEVKTKIQGVKKTSQITKAMNMVAAAKVARRTREDGGIPSLYPEIQ